MCCSDIDLRSCSFSVNQTAASGKVSALVYQQNVVCSLVQIGLKDPVDDVDVLKLVFVFLLN